MTEYIRKTPVLDPWLANLSKYPREIVHCIFDYLPCRSVLDLAASRYGRDPIPTHQARAQSLYIDQCILTHLAWRVTFPSPDDYYRIISIWSLWRAIQWSLGLYSLGRLARFHGYSPSRYHRYFSSRRHQYLLGVSDLLASSNFFSKRQPSGDEILQELLEAIRAVLTKFRDELKTLGLYTQKELPCPAARYITLIRQGLIKKPWSDVNDAAARFNNLRCQQLEKMAELFESYPSLLKKAADPTQTPRKNFEHIARHLRASARWIIKDQSLRLFRRKWHQFRHEIFPVVPLNSCLRLFVRTLERYPLMATWKVQRPPVNTTIAMEGRPGNRTAKLEDALDNLTLDSTAESTRIERSCTERIYPPSNVTAIECAKKGMAYVYIEPRKLSLTPATQVYRTKYTPYSAQPFKTKSYDEVAVFMLPWYPHLAEAYETDKLCKDSPNPRFPSKRMSQPYDEREVQWLEAFLMACDFMAKLD